jgi:NADPH-dependent ferric siderophore reductase
MSYSLTRYLRNRHFERAVITDVCDINQNFRFVSIHSDAFRTCPESRGHKVHFRVNDINLRTYIPIRCNPCLAVADFLLFLPRNGPGSSWATSLAKGDVCQVRVSKPSLNVTQVKGRTVFFGDETSIASAMTLSQSAYAAYEHTYVFEASSLPLAEQMIRHAGLVNSIVVQKRIDRAHLSEVAPLSFASSRDLTLPNWIFTGCKQSIRRLQQQLVHDGIRFTEMIVKPYWTEGEAASA